MLTFGYNPLRQELIGLNVILFSFCFTSKYHMHIVLMWNANNDGNVCKTQPGLHEEKLTLSDCAPLTSAYFLEGC